MKWEAEGISKRGSPKKTWWDCVKEDMYSLGLSQKDAQFGNKRRRIKGATGYARFTWKMAVKTVCLVSHMCAWR